MSLLNRIPVLSRLSVHNKVSVTMVVIFMLVIGTVTAYTIEREKERILDIGEQITKSHPRRAGKKAIRGWVSGRTGLGRT